MTVYGAVILCTFYVDPVRCYRTREPRSECISRREKWNIVNIPAGRFRKKLRLVNDNGRASFVALQQKPDWIKTEIPAMEAEFGRCVFFNQLNILH